MGCEGGLLRVNTIWAGLNDRKGWAMRIVLVIFWADIINRPSKSNGLKNKKFLYFLHDSSEWVFRLWVGSPLYPATQADGLSVVFKFWLPRSSWHHRPDWLGGKELGGASWEFSMSQSECHLCSCSLGVNLVTWSPQLQGSLGNVV